MPMVLSSPINTLHQTLLGIEQSSPVLHLCKRSLHAGLTVLKQTKLMQTFHHYSYRSPTPLHVCISFLRIPFLHGCAVKLTLKQTEDMLAFHHFSGRSPPLLSDNDPGYHPHIPHSPVSMSTTCYCIISIYFSSQFRSRDSSNRCPEQTSTASDAAFWRLHF